MAAGPRARGSGSRASARRSCRATRGRSCYTRCCLYDMPPDRDFVVDRVPGAAAAVGLHRRGARGEVRRPARADPLRARDRRRDGVPDRGVPGRPAGARRPGRSRPATGSVASPRRPERSAGRCSLRISSIAEAAGERNAAGRVATWMLRNGRSGPSERRTTDWCGGNSARSGQQRDAGAGADELADRGVVVALERHARDEAGPRAGAAATWPPEVASGHVDPGLVREVLEPDVLLARERMVAMQRELEVILEQVDHLDALGGALRRGRR